MNLNTMCRCCLAQPPDKDLKSVYTCLDKTEVYGDMLKECFEIHLSIEPCDSENGICEICIARLRDASDFKHQVLRCQKEFQIKLTTSSDIKVEDMPQFKEEDLDIEENDISILVEDMPQIKEEYVGIEESDISVLGFTMARKKQTKKEQIREKAKLDRRKRYAMIKSDPVKYAIEKEKEHQRYMKRKETKQILSINDMTPKAKKRQRKKWRDNFRKYYQRHLSKNRGVKPMDENTSSGSDTDDPLRIDNDIG